MSRRDDEINDELQAHLNMAIRDRIERGEDPREAEAAARRTSEIGLRMALGATQGNVLTLILKHALTLIGVAIGAGVVSQAPELPASVALPAVIGAAVMLSIALLAAYIPARRAARIEPIRALRCE